MTRLYLIRHGTNDHREDGILAGWMPGVHLNQQGRAQVKALAQRLAPVEIETIYASPLERTLETAEIIAAPHGLPVVVCEGLGEVRFGRWTGQTLERLRRRRLWRAMQFAPSTVCFPGGESMREVQARVVTVLEGLRTKHPQQTVIVVSHADTIKTAVAFYIGLPLDLFQRLVIAPASLTVLELGGPVPRLVCLNDTGHLPPIVEGGKWDSLKRSN
ncbi:MAG: MSMEG_4193 family putative phosphomutase [Anaerolineae bacterium]